MEILHISKDYYHQTQKREKRIVGWQPGEYLDKIFNGESK